MTVAARGKDTETGRIIYRANRVIGDIFWFIFQPSNF